MQNIGDVFEIKRLATQYCLYGITDSMDMSLGNLRELVMDRRPGVLQFMGSQRVGHD